MKKCFVVGSLLLLSALAAAETPIDGTWKIKLDTAQFSQKPSNYEVKDGKWTCSSCLAKNTIKADGSDQKVKGDPGFDTLAVKVVDDRHVETTAKRAGKEVGHSKMEVSEDGNTLTTNWDGMSESGQQVSGKTESKRVGAAPSSGNKVTGQWQTEKVEGVTDNAVTMTYTSSGDEVTYKQGTGENYTAKLDGKDYPMKGDPGSDMVSLKLIDDHTLQETYKKGGKPVYISTMKVMPDGKTMEITGEDKRRGTTDKVTAEKQ